MRFLLAVSLAATSLFGLSLVTGWSEPQTLLSESVTDPNVAAVPFTPSGVAEQPL